MKAVVLVPVGTEESRHLGLIPRLSADSEVMWENEGMLKVKKVRIILTEHHNWQQQGCFWSLSPELTGDIS